MKRNIELRTTTGHPISAQTFQNKKPMAEISLTQRIDGAQFLPFLAALSGVGSASEITIDFQYLRRVSPAALAALVATVVRWRREKRRLNFHNLNDCVIKGYLQRMDALNLCGVELPENFSRRDERGRFVPVRLIEQDVDKLGGDVASCLAPGGEDLEHRMAGLYDFSSYVLTETANNARQHSRGLGYASAQVMRQEGMVRIAIADNGRGILKSFQEAELDWSFDMDDVRAIKKALEPKVSSRGRPANEGVGMTVVSALTRLAKGWMSIISGRGVVRMANGGEIICDYLPGDAYYKGTLVSLAFKQAAAADYHGLLQAAKTQAGLLPSRRFRAKFER